MPRFDRTQRVGGLAGLVFVALSLAVAPLGVLPPPLPTVGATGADFANWYAAHRTSFLVVNWLGVAAFVPGFVQLAALTASIRAREGEPAFLSTLVQTAGTFAYAVFAGSLCAFQAMPFLVDARQAAAAEALGTLTTVWFALDGLAAVPLIVAVGWAGAATGALPRAVVGSCVPVALAMIAMSLGALTTAPPWLAAGGPATATGLGVFFGWIGALAIVQLRSAAAVETATSGAHPP